MRTAGRVGVLCVATVGLALGVRAEAEERHKLAATRAPVAPRIDGIVDDEVWALAAPDDRFTQLSPVEGDAPTESTEMRVLYDDDAIYVSFVCHDRAPDKIVGRLTRRDREVESDWVAFLVDSRDDGATGYVFRVNAAGVQIDELYYNDTQESYDWDAVWESATHRGDDGWSAELRVPLSVLRFPERELQDWGFQAARYISRTRENLFWQLIPHSAQGFVSLSGRLTGLEHIKPRRTFELRPYAAARVTSLAAHGHALLGNGHASQRTESEVNVGLDAKLGITSDLTLDATVNPDFGQVEADEIVLNLSRFETFFPEKRPFFLESLDLFQMIDQPFYTRRVGPRPGGLNVGDTLTLDDGREAAVVSAPHALRILGAAKLTGKIARPLQVGLVAAITGAETVTVEDSARVADEVETSPARAYAVGRLRYDFGDASYVGILGTALARLGGSVRRPEANHDAYTGAVDTQWILSSRWRLAAQAMISSRQGGPPTTRSDGTVLESGDLGWGVTSVLQGSGTGWMVRAFEHSYSPYLDLNDLGYLPQFNEHQLKVQGGYTRYVPRGAIRSLELIPTLEATITSDGVLRGVNPGFYGEALFDNYLFATAVLNTQLPGGRDTHETFDGARYQTPFYAGLELGLNTDDRKALVARNHVSAYLATDGTGSASVGTELLLQVLPQLELAVAPSLQLDRSLRFYRCHGSSGMDCAPADVERDYAFALLDSSVFSVTLRGSWTFSTRLSLTTYAQLFLDRGRWSDPRHLVTQGTRPDIDRGDLASFDDAGPGDFEDASLNLNIVLRWEFQPGSTLIGVYTRSETSRVDLQGKSPGLRLSGLGTGPTEDSFLLKLVLFVG